MIIGGRHVGAICLPSARVSAVGVALTAALWKNCSSPGRGFGSLLGSGDQFTKWALPGIEWMQPHR